MTENSINSAPWLILNAIMTEEYRETVVRRALGYRKDATQRARKAKSVTLTESGIERAREPADRYLDDVQSSGSWEHSGSERSESTESANSRAQWSMLPGLETPLVDLVRLDRDPGGARASERLKNKRE